MSCPDRGRPETTLGLLAQAGRDLEALIVATCPPGTTRDAALIHLKEAVYHARAAVLEQRRP